MSGTTTAAVAHDAVVAVAGLIASGKSTVSRALAARLGAERLEADRVRGTLLEAFGDDPSGIEGRWRRDLSESMEQEIYSDLLQRAELLLADGKPLVVDACFPLRAQREALRALAAKHGRRFLLVMCSVPEAERRERLAERDRAVGRPVWEAIDRRLADHYETPVEFDAEERIDVVSVGATEPIVARVVEQLRRVRPPISEAMQGILRPRVVSFDCWGTLLSEEDWPWAHRLRIGALQEAAREAGRMVPFDAAKRAFEAAWQRHQVLWEKGEASGAAEIADWGLAELGLEGREPSRSHLVRRFEEASHSGWVVAIEGARELLATLSVSGTPCVLVCDTGLTPGRVVRRHLAHNGLLEHLEALAFSDEVGVPKPDPRPFRSAIEGLDVEPSEVLHVGDLRRTDVAGARTLGMQTARIRARHDDDSDYEDADHVVDSYAALGRLLGFRIHVGAEEAGD